MAYASASLSIEINNYSGGLSTFILRFFMETIKKQYRSGERIKDSGSGSKSGRSDNWIFFTAVLISILFWILIKLSDPYTVPYSLRVNYKSIPKEKRLTFITDSFVNVNVGAPGFEIIKLNLFEDMDVLDINLNNFSLMKKEGQEYYVYTDELIEKLAEVIHIPKKNVHFSKNTLSFTLTELSEKTLAVTSLVELQFAEQYELYEVPLLNPQLIKAYGPADVLDAQQQIYTDHKLIAEVNSNPQLCLSEKCLYSTERHQGRIARVW